MSTLPERILDWTQSYTESLTEDYKQHSIRMSENYTSDYSKRRLESIKNGRKYYKIMQHDFDTFQDRNEYKEGCVHAFVDKNTGEVYKPASYNAPAKHVRYDLRIINDRVKLHDPDYTGWAGGYLYMR